MSTAGIASHKGIVASQNGAHPYFVFPKRDSSRTYDIISTEDLNLVFVFNVTHEVTDGGMTKSGISLVYYMPLNTLLCWNH